MNNKRGRTLPTLLIGEGVDDHVLQGGLTRPPASKDPDSERWPPMPGADCCRERFREQDSSEPVLTSGVDRLVTGEGVILATMRRVLVGHVPCNTPRLRDWGGCPESKLALGARSCTRTVGCAGLSNRENRKDLTFINGAVAGQSSGRPKSLSRHPHAAGMRGGQLQGSGGDARMMPARKRRKF